jgi:site-specific recombinase XerD
MVTPSDLRRVADEFQSALGAHRYSLHTQESYGKELRRVFALLAPPERAPTGRDWTAAGIQRVFDTMIQRGSSAVSVARALSACRLFERYCVERRYLDSTPAQETVLRCVANDARDDVSLGMFEAVLDGPDASGRITSRERAVLHLIGAAGLTTAELTRVRYRDLDPRSGRLTVRDADGPIREVTLSPGARRALEEHAAAAGGPQGPAAFVIAARALQPMSVRTANALVRSGLRHVAQRLGVEVRDVERCFEVWRVRWGATVREARHAVGPLSRARARRFAPASRPRGRAGPPLRMIG